MAMTKHEKVQKALDAMIAHASALEPEASESGVSIEYHLAPASCYAVVIDACNPTNNEVVLATTD